MFAIILLPFPDKLTYGQPEEEYCTLFSVSMFNDYFH